MCKHIVRRHWKCSKHMSSYSHNKKLSNSTSEGTWKLPSYLSLIFCRFRIITPISKSSCGTRAIAHDLFIATAAKQVPRDWYASTISELKFSNTNLRIFTLWCMTHRPGSAPTKWNMNIPKAKSAWGHQFIQGCKLRLTFTAWRL